MAISTFIKEAFIEQRIGALEDEAKIQEWIGDFLASEPVLASFIFSEDVNILKEEEKELYTYIIAGIWATIAKEYYESANLVPDQVAEIEEQNWDKFQQQKGSFREKLDAFFSGFNQEDLLALIEDLLEVDLIDEPLSSEGRDLIFIKSKSFLDALIAEKN